jgi:hypothetical protein
MSRVTQYLHLHHHHGATDPDEPHPPMGGSRNEALGLMLVLLILILIGAAFFWQAARRVSGVTYRTRADDSALRFDGNVVVPRAGSFSGVRDSWMETDGRALRERPVERVALFALDGENRSI